MAFNMNVSRPIQIERAKWRRMDPDIQRGIMTAWLDRRKAIDDFNVRRIDEKLDITAAPFDEPGANQLKKNYYDKIQGIQPRQPQDLDNAINEFIQIKTSANTDPLRQAYNTRGKYFQGRLAEMDQVKHEGLRNLLRNNYLQEGAADVLQNPDGSYNLYPGANAPVVQMPEWTKATDNLISTSKPLREIKEDEITYMEGPNGELLGYTRKKGEIEKLPANTLYTNIKTALATNPEYQDFYRAVDGIEGAKELYLGDLDRYIMARANLSRVDNESVTYKDNYLSDKTLAGGDGSGGTDMFTALTDGQITSMVATKEGLELDPDVARETLNAGAEYLSQYTVTLPGEVQPNGLVGEDRQMTLDQLLDDPTGSWLKWKDNELNVQDIRENLKGPNGEDLPMSRKEQILSDLSKFATMKRDKNLTIEDMENSDEVQFAPGSIEPYLGMDEFYDMTGTQRLNYVKEKYGVDLWKEISDINKQLYSDLEAKNEQANYQNLAISDDKKVFGDSPLGNALYGHNYESYANKRLQELAGVSESHIKKVNKEFDKAYAKHMADTYTKRETAIGSDYSIDPTAKQLGEMSAEEQGTIAMANRMQEDFNKNMVVELGNYRVYSENGQRMDTLKDDDEVFLSADKEGGDPFKIEGVKTQIDMGQLLYSDHLERHRMKAVLTTFDDEGNAKDKRVIFLEGDNIERLAMKADGKINEQQFRKQYVTKPLEDKDFLVKTFKPNEGSDDNFGYIANRVGPNTFNLVMFDRTNGEYTELTEEGISEEKLSNILYNKYLYEIIKESQFSGAGGGSSAGK